MKHVLIAAFMIAPAAHAHFRLATDAGFPQDWLETDSLGDPTGGSQKTPEPCGGGTMPTNAVMTVTAGSQLALEWTETVGHPGWYRIAIATNRSEFPTPVSQGGASCDSATIEDPVVAPVIADNVFPHTQPQMNHVYDTTVTVPNLNCDACTLQIVEFMGSHPSPCFYHHCATLKIIGATGAGGGTQSGTGGGTASSGGGTASTGGGSSAEGGGTASTGGGASATGGGTSTATGGGTASSGGGATAGTGGGTSPATGGGAEKSGGCSSATGGEAAALLALGALVTLIRSRRRRS